MVASLGLKIGVIRTAINAPIPQSAMLRVIPIKKGGVVPEGLSNDPRVIVGNFQNFDVKGRHYLLSISHVDECFATITIFAFDGFRAPR